MLPTIAWRGRSVVMIDQRLLPAKEIYNSYTDHLGVAEAQRHAGL
jgi:methylthioribose-1-phosphate isomerase